MTPQQLRERRRALGMSQGILAEHLGPPVRQQHVSNWENGTRSITAHRGAWLDMKLAEIEGRERKRRARVQRELIDQGRGY